MVDLELNWGTQNFEKVFQNINEFVTVTEKQEYTVHYDNVLHYITRKMRDTNNLFDKMFRRSELGGSYADNLKVAKPNEFDTDIILELPVNSTYVNKCKRKLDLVEIRIMNSEDKELLKLMDDDCYLLQNKVFKWVISILDTVLLKETRENNVYNLIIKGNHYKIKKSQSGPAMTLKVEVPEYSNRIGNTIKFDMDIVVSFEFKKAQWVGTKRYPNYIQKEDHPWTAIPKPDRSTQINRGFRTSYRAIERDMIKNRGRMKELIKLFKKMRDKNETQLGNLKSYHIKTIFMLHDEHLRQIGNIDFWSKCSTTKIFVTMFNKLLDHLQREHLPFFWEPNHNMFSEMSRSQLLEIRNRVLGVLRDLRKINEPSLILTTFKKQEIIYVTFLTSTERRCILDPEANVLYGGEQNRDRDQNEQRNDIYQRGEELVEHQANNNITTSLLVPTIAVAVGAGIIGLVSWWRNRN